MPTTTAKRPPAPVEPPYYGYSVVIDSGDDDGWYVEHYDDISTKDYGHPHRLTPVIAAVSHYSNGALYVTTADQVTRYDALEPASALEIAGQLARKAERDGWTAAVWEHVGAGVVRPVDRVSWHEGDGLEEERRLEEDHFDPGYGYDD